MNKRKFFLILPLLIISLLFAYRYFLADLVTPLVAGIKIHKQTILPVDIEQAIEKLAKQYLKEGYDPQIIDLDVEADPEDVHVIKSKILPDNPLYPLKEIDRSIKEFFTFDPPAKAYIVLRHSQWEMLESILLLKQAVNEKDVNVRTKKVEQAALTLEKAKKEFKRIADLANSIRDGHPVEAKLTDEVAGRYAAEWLSYQLILEKVQDSLDDKSLLRIEKARQIDLEAFSRILLKSAGGNSQALALELSYEIQSQSGTDHSLIRTIEILQELEDVSPEQDKLSIRIAQFMLARTFEENLNRLSKDEHDKLILSLIQNIKGNPLKQFRGYDRMKRFFKSRETVLLAEILKSTALTDLEQRILSLTDQFSYEQFIQTGIKNGLDDLRVLAALDFKLTLDPKADINLKDRVAKIHTLVDKVIIARLLENPDRLKNSSFAKRVANAADLLDVRVINILSRALSQNSNLDPGLKPVLNSMQQNILKYITNKYKKSANANNPQLASILNDLVDKKLATNQELSLEAAVRAEQLIDNALSDQTNPTPQTVEQVISDLDKNSAVGEAVAPMPVETELENVSQTIEVVDSSNQHEHITAKTEQLIEEIFSSRNHETPVEMQLPPGIQKEIEHLKNAVDEIPVIQTPAPQVTQPAPTEAVQPTSGSSNNGNNSGNSSDNSNKPDKDKKEK